jgi:hypothetical protein
MSNNFKREARYVVLKNADIMQCLTVNELIELRRIQAKAVAHRAKLGKPWLDCVVVESDWPEYEPTWRAIEARASNPAAISGQIDRLEAAEKNLSCCRAEREEAAALFLSVKTKLIAERDALQDKVGQVIKRLQLIIEEPEKTVSNSHAIREMLRQATLALKEVK